MRQELASLETLEAEDIAASRTLASQAFNLESSRDTRLRDLLNLEQTRDRRYRDLEQAKLNAINSALPSASENARYILAQLMTSGRCLTCGTLVPTVATQLSGRIKTHHCVVCDSLLATKDEVVVPIAAALITKAETEIDDFDVSIAALKSTITSLTEDIEKRDRARHEVRLRQLERSVAISKLEAELPNEGGSQRGRFNVIAAMRADLEERKEQLAKLRASYGKVLGPINTQLRELSDRIKSAFEQVAREFLLEELRLDWSPYRSSLGQTGPAFELPAFGLDMGGGAFPSLVRRESPDQVSESQREFIDLAFRMALISVAGIETAGSLVIDAPESSLDSVFVRRASAVLGRFARGKSNRLIITSNLVDGDLIPFRLRDGAHVSKAANIVNLFEIAAPTAATERLAHEYEAAQRRLLKPAARDPRHS